MIRDICKDELFLTRKAAPALPEDLPIAQDLLETLIAHKDSCVGMAANMIGVAKRIIAFESEDGYLIMFNLSSSKSPGRTKRRRLSLPHRHPEDQTVPDHQGAVAERKVPAPHQDLLRLDSRDHPARARPLRRHPYLTRLARQKPCGIPQGFSVV